MDWFRAYHGMPYDPILGVVAKRVNTNSAEALAVLVALLDYASRNVPRGSLEGFDAEPVATALGLEPEMVEAMVDCLRAKRFITDENAIFGWEQLQPRANDRLRRHRAGQYRKRRRKKDATRSDPRIGRPHGGDEARAEALLLLRKQHDTMKGDRP
jgi:hypothetical protein